MRHRRFLCSKPLLQDYTIRQDELIDRWTPYPKSSPRSTSSSDDIGRETFVGGECVRQSDKMASLLVALVIFAILVLIASTVLIFGLGPGLTRLLGTIILFAIVFVGLWVAGTIAKRERAS